MCFKIFKCRSGHYGNGFKMIYYSTLSDDYLWKLIFRGKQKKKEKKKKHPNTKFLPFFQMGGTKAVF